MTSGTAGGRPGRWSKTDVVAGLTLASVAIPEAMGYTKIAGMPVVTGIYTVALPAAAFALIGSSRHLVVGADSATAAILFAGLGTIAIPNSPRYVALAGTVALMAGGFLGMARLLRLGFLADFLSRTALVGFLSGVGIHVAAGQLPDMLGAGLLSAAIAGATLALVFVSERINRRLPAALCAVILGVAATAALGLDRLGIRTVGSISGGLPRFQAPSASWSTMPHLLGVAASIALVVLAQSAATARGFAQRHHEEFNENRDLLGLAAAELAAGFSGTFPVNGSPTKTAVADAAGGRTQLVQLTASVAAVLVLMFATGLLRLLPEAVLAAIVFTIGVKLLDLVHLGELWRVRRDEFFVALATLAVVVLGGVEPGIIFAVVLSVLDYVRRGYRPRDVVMTVAAEPGAHPVPVTAALGAESLPGTIIYRFDAPLFFANADYFGQRLLALIRAAPHPVERVILDFSPVGDIDYTAGKVLKGVIAELRGRHIAIRLAHTEDVRGLLDRYGIIDAVGAGQLFSGLREALASTAS